MDTAIASFVPQRGARCYQAEGVRWDMAELYPAAMTVFRRKTLWQGCRGMPNAQKSPNSLDNILKPQTCDSHFGMTVPLRARSPGNPVRGTGDKKVFECEGDKGGEKKKKRSRICHTYKEALNESHTKAAWLKPPCNPRLGIRLTATWRYRPAQFIIKRLYARRSYFSRQKENSASPMELLAITKEWCDAIRDFAARELGFERDAVAIHAVQNHSSPSMGRIMLSDRLEAAKKYPWIRGSDPDYGPLAMEKIKPMIRAAMDNLQPVRLIFGSTLDSRVSFNRRIAMRDGTSEMGFGRRHEYRPEQALYREGPSDPEVGVAIFTTPELQTIAALLHHTCHPVTVPHPRSIRLAGPGEGDPQHTPLTLFPCLTAVHSQHIAYMC